jgi:HEAT repeat protein
MTSVSNRLSSLVQAESDPEVVVFVLTQFANGIAIKQGCFATSVNTVRQTAARQLVQVIWTNAQKKAIETQKKAIAELDGRDDEFCRTLQRVLQEHVDEAELFVSEEARERLLQAISCESLENLRPRLSARSPVARWLTVQVVKSRRIPLEAELIELLNDPENGVRQAARQALLRLSRGTDFGPLPGWTVARRERAVARWRSWLALQHGAAPESVALSGPADEDVPPSRPGLGPFGKIAPAPSDAALQTEDARAAELCDELVAATGEERDRILLRLKDAKGADHTEAIALAIPKLGREARLQARDALAERLTRMTAKTLKAYLQDDDAELRAAAARACALKDDKALAGGLIALLDDADDRVRGAAHGALKELAGQDLGPQPGATADERRAAAGRWRAWWNGQQGQ